MAYGVIKKMEDGVQRGESRRIRRFQSSSRLARWVSGMWTRRGRSSSRASPRGAYGIVVVEAEAERRNAAHAKSLWSTQKQSDAARRVACGFVMVRSKQKQSGASRRGACRFVVVEAAAEWHA